MQSREPDEGGPEVLSVDAVSCAESLLEGKEGVASTLVKNLLGALKHGSQGDPFPGQFPTMNMPPVSYKCIGPAFGHAGFAASWRSVVQR